MDYETQDDRTVVAEYVCDLTTELAVMAAGADHVDLARLLEMARLESERLCGRTSEGAEPEADAARGTQDAAGESQSANVVVLSALRSARR
jgi:hypothetical protein